MKRVCLALLMFSATIRAETLQEHAWQLNELPAQENATVVAGEKNGAALKMHNPDALPRKATAWSIVKPDITAQQYALRGQVRYEGVEPRALLELWSIFPDGSRYFSRTLAATGEMATLTGTSDWREFTLPFDRTGTTSPPASLEFNVIFEGKGTVFLGPVRLEQYPSSAPDQWWGEREAGLIGGIIGGLLGLLGAAIGLCVSRGKARGFVLGALNAMLALGLCALIAGCVALSMKQPYAVYYPLLLLGLLATVIPLPMKANVRRRYEELELRKMAAMDA